MTAGRRGRWSSAAGWVKTRREHVGRRGREVARHAARRETVARRSPGMRRKGHSHVRREPVAGDELHLVDPLLLAALVLEPDLDDAHGEAGVFGQLLPHLAGRLRVLVEAGLEDLELLGLDCGAGPTALPVLAYLTVFHVVLVVLVLGAVLRRRPGLPLDGGHRVVAGRAAVAATRVVQVKVLVGVAADAAVRDSRRRTVTMLDVVNLTEEITLVVAAHLVALRQVGRAVPAREAVRVKERVADLARLVRLGEDELAGRAPRTKQPVKVLPTIELTELGEARVGEGEAAAGALEALLVQGAVPHAQHVLVLDVSVTLGADLHVRHCC